MTLPEKMKAVGFFRPLPVTDPEYLVDLELDLPIPQNRDLLVQVKAVSVNPADVKSRAGAGTESAAPRILGWDAAGTVVGTGPGCTLFQPGDDVYYAGSIDRPGCNSEYHLVDERIAGRKPRSLSFAEAAALPLTSITAWEGLFDRLGLPFPPGSGPRSGQQRNSSILLIGAAGGVGSVAVQLAKRAGLSVIGTASREESAQWVRACGADEVIDHNKPLLPQLRALGLEYADYVFCLHDTVTHWSGMAEAIRPQGAICSIVPPREPVNLGLLFQKSVSFHWELMFTRSMFGTEDMIEQHQLLNAVSGMVDGGELRSTMTRLMKPLNASTLRSAHEQILTGRMTGKLVLEGFE